jgi:glycosyltransferase involved in cell wall biosynthesis
MSAKMIGIIPNARGVGGPASFNEKLVIGLRSLGVETTYDLSHPQIEAVLVIAGSRHLGTLTRIKKRGIPIIQRLDGMNWTHRRRYTGVKHFLRSEINNWILQYIRTRLADRIIYQSEFSRDWWQRVYGKAPVTDTIIYNGVDLDQYKPAKVKSRQESLQVMVVEGHIQNGLELGLRNAIAGLDAYSQLTSQPVELMIAGEVPLAVRHEMMRGSRITFNWVGILPRPEIARRERQADLFFSAEPNPACPNAVIEAMASGLPVAAYESGAIRELLDDRCGILTPYGADIWKLEPADSDLMALHLKESMARISEMGLHARRSAEARFDLDQMTRQYKQVIVGN